MAAGVDKMPQLRLIGGVGGAAGDAVPPAMILCFDAAPPREEVGG
jgi:hypothetical protein